MSPAKTPPTERLLSLGPAGPVNWRGLLYAVAMDLIHDPHDVNMALRTADLRLMYRGAAMNAQETREWVLLDELKKPGADPKSVTW